MSWITLILLNSLAVVLADYFVEGIKINGLIPALLAGLSLGIVNTFVRPVLMVLTFPLTILTLGIFILVLNALTFTLAAFLVPGFHIYGFWGAFWGALLTSVVGWVLNLLFNRD